MYTKYLQIPYKHLGSSFDGADCWGLIRLYYATEFGISLPELNYPAHWHIAEPTKILDTYDSLGFAKTETVKNGNIVIFKEGSFYKHLGVVVKAPYVVLHTTRAGTLCEYKPTLPLPTTYMLEYRGLNDSNNR